ncbi:MAG: hypothetical protein GY828_08520 [Candidatus Gracilibacteria bacterium]|nr:hypothetical protein [Candidatus Gracilibacteria bacterium]
MLYYLSARYHNSFQYIFRFFIRFGVILHELCHLLFGVLSGAKVHSVELFRKDGGRVTFETKNYIGHLSQYSGHPGYMFKLILNQIGIFLTSLGPLLFGVFMTYLLIYLLGFPINISDIEGFVGELNIKQIGVFLIYMIMIPSFLLSFQDVKNFIVSKQDTLGATIVGSIINTVIFTIFLGFLTFFYKYFLFFGIIYLIIFTFLICIFVLHKVFFIIQNLYKKGKNT